MTIAAKRRWFQLSLRELFLALLAIGFALAWLEGRWPKSPEELTIEEASDQMISLGRQEMLMMQRKEADGWWDYRMRRSKSE